MLLSDPTRRRAGIRASRPDNDHRPGSDEYRAHREGRSHAAPEARVDRCYGAVPRLPRRYVDEASSRHARRMARAVGSAAVTRGRRNLGRDAALTVPSCVIGPHWQRRRVHLRASGSAGADTSSMVHPRSPTRWWTVVGHVCVQTQSVASSIVQPSRSKPRGAELDVEADACPPVPTCDRGRRPRRRWRRVRQPPAPSLPGRIDGRYANHSASTRRKASSGDNWRAAPAATGSWTCDRTAWPSDQQCRAVREMLVHRLARHASASRHVRQREVLDAALRRRGPGGVEQTLSGPTIGHRPHGVGFGVGDGEAVAT